MSDRTERVVARATPRIVEALGADGVTGIQCFLAFRGEPIIWLVTTTDREKAQVAERGFFRELVCRLLAEAGLPDELAAHAGVTVESEETVARDFEGSWFYAMR